MISVPDNVLNTFSTIFPADVHNVVSFVNYFHLSITVALSLTVPKDPIHLSITVALSLTVPKSHIHLSITVALSLTAYMDALIPPPLI